MEPTHDDRGRLISAVSDDGLVEARQVPITPLSGEWALVCKTSGKPMTRGYYQDFSRSIQMGTLTDEKVPDAIWASAIELMDECSKEIAEHSARVEARAIAKDEARHSDLSVWLSAEMDNPRSDL